MRRDRGLGEHTIQYKSLRSFGEGDWPHVFMEEREGLQRGTAVRPGVPTNQNL